MKKQIQVVAAFALALSSVSFAQQAVQWRVQDGGNGHWYQLIVAGPVSWHVAKGAAESRGGHLATLTSDPEKRFVQSVVSSTPGFGESAVRRWGPWLGGKQDRSASDYSEPLGGWRWVTGEPWSYAAWPSYQPDNWCAETQVEEDFLTFAGWFLQSDGAWNDLPANGCDNDPVVSYVTEWSADCNNDGIVDYGQCRDGTLPDYNGNNIPDCCEVGSPCVVGTYPVQWRVQDGGNGHWYAFVASQTISWSGAESASRALGGHLATTTSPQELEFVWTVVNQSQQAWNRTWGPFLGATRRDLPSWQWVTGEPWDFSAWGPGEPNNDSGGSGSEDRLSLLNIAPSGLWNDVTDSGCAGTQCDARTSTGYVVEWSADCSNDGIIDKGQILRGQLQDANADGVPDVCQQPTCADADIYRDFNVNGADLGILLSQWGPNTPLTESDFNHDGAVDGADLGVLLGFWGPCP